MYLRIDIMGIYSSCMGRPTLCRSRAPHQEAVKDDDLDDNVHREYRWDVRPRSLPTIRAVCTSRSASAIDRPQAQAVRHQAPDSSNKFVNTFAHIFRSTYLDIARQR